MTRSTNSKPLQARFVNQYLELEEPPAQRYSIAAVILIGALLIGGLVWSAITPVVELAYARGEVIPNSLPHRIQHSAGGRIAQLSVANGAGVRKGDRLVLLDGAELRSQINQLESRYSAYAIEAQRLQAALKGEYIDLQADEKYADLVAKQNSSHLRELANLADRRSVLAHEVAQRQAELTRYNDEAESLAPRVGLLEQKLSMLTQVRESGDVSELVLIETRSALAQTNADQVKVLGAARAAESALASARARLSQVESESQRELAARASVIASELLELEQGLQGLQHRLANLALVAPIDGVAKFTNFATVNTVVGAGEVIMEIIPVKDELLVQALIPTAEIGYVSVGLDTRIEFDGFDRNVHGMMPGTVRQISPTTYIDPEGVPYYQIEVALEGARRTLSGRSLVLIPGMTAQVEIVTGEKTLLAYLGRPVLRGLQDAFHER